MGNITSRYLAAVFALAMVCARDAGPVQAKDIALTHETVSRFLSTLAELRVIALSEGMKIAPEMQGDGNPFNAVIKAVTATKLQKEAGAVVTKHGFTGLRDWSETGGAIGQAYLAAAAGPSKGAAGAAVEKHKEAAAKQLDKLSFLSAKQKQKLKNNIETASHELSREPPAENVAVVRAMKTEIEAAAKVR